MTSIKISIPAVQSQSPTFSSALKVILTCTAYSPDTQIVSGDTVAAEEYEFWLMIGSGTKGILLEIVKEHKKLTDANSIVRLCASSGNEI